MEDETRAAFSRLQSHCARLARDASRDNVAHVIRELQSIQCAEVMQNLQEYVLFPLRVIIKKNQAK